MISHLMCKGYCIASHPLVDGSEITSSFASTGDRFANTASGVASLLSGVSQTLGTGSSSSVAYRRRTCVEASMIGVSLTIRNLKPARRTYVATIEIV